MVIAMTYAILLTPTEMAMFWILGSATLGCLIALALILKDGEVHDDRL
jgi:hypothetical protein